MIEFSEFKRQVCNFYRQSKMNYFIWYIPEYYKCSIQISFRMDNIDVLFTYVLAGSSNDSQRIKKAEKLTKEISKDLKGIENEC